MWIFVAKSLKKHGFDAEPIHGDLDQSHRTRTLDGFRAGTIRFSRGLRRGRAGARHPKRKPCVQLRRPQPRRRLRAPHRPHRPRGTQGRRHLAGGAFGREVSRRDPGPDRNHDPPGRAAMVPRGSTGARRPEGSAPRRKSRNPPGGVVPRRASPREEAPEPAAATPDETASETRTETAPEPEPQPERRPRRERG